MTGKRTGPGGLARCVAMLASFLLTITLTVTVLAAAAVHGISSEELHIKAATNDKVTAEQHRQIEEFIAELAEDYGFSAGRAVAAVSGDELPDLGRDMARWWTRMVNEGVLDDMPEWSSDSFRTAVAETLAESALPEDMSREEVAEEVTELVQRRVREVVMPVRKVLMQKGFQYVRKKVDPADAVRFVKEGTVLTGAASIVLAGIILFMTGRKVRFSLRYFGAALAGAGIAGLFGGLLIRSAGIQSMIADISEGMGLQTGYIFRTVTIEAGAGTGILFVAGIVCLILYIRRPAGGEA